jgi:hypothetical chaperone protein
MKERSASVHPPVGAGVGVGIDFGTTNSAVSVARADGTVDIVRFPAFGDVLPYFRSVVFFEPPEPGRAVPGVRAGPDAMAHSIAGDEGRLMQSLKSFLPSKLVTRTQVYSRAYALEEIIGAFLKRLRAAAEQVVGPLGDRAVVGRPVRFVKDAEDDDHPDALAIERLRRAFALAGFTDVTLAMEPVAAALAYQAGLRSAGDVRAHRVLVGDFGGGTSDFTVMEVGGEGRVLSTVGVPLAGDSFDARIVHRVVAPRLGLGSHYRRGVLAGDKPIEVPRWIYKNLERWHHLSFLRETETMHLLREIVRGSDAPEAIRMLMALVRENLGFQLYRAVERTKVALSHDEQASFVFAHGEVDIRETVTRGQFEGWIAPELAQIATGIDEALTRAGCVPEDIGRVFLTGGTAYVPAVRRLFEARFGPERLSGGNELTSVAYGLAELARAEAAGRTPVA